MKYAKVFVNIIVVMSTYTEKSDFKQMSMKKMRDEYDGQSTIRYRWVINNCGVICYSLQITLYRVELSSVRR